MLAKLHVAPPLRRWLNKLVSRAFSGAMSRLSAESRDLWIPAGQENATMATAEKRDTYFVRPDTKRAADDRSPTSLNIDTLTLPSGSRVHALDRRVFDQAVKAAMTDKK